MNEDVVILICRVNDNNSCWGNWGNSSWNCDNCNNINNRDDIVVDSSSDPRVSRGSNCANTIKRLLNAGYKLINTNVIQDCGIKIVYTFVKYRHRPTPTPPPNPCGIESISPDNCASC
ncbi:hypothetical protein SDC9_160669 [bioreactor metagenome]|uniref:Uncharacterized protein n=1 Tax=bioreactor metagenome TaxID=1076179 RepID=A0A645FG38_9ZZZZ